MSAPDDHAADRPPAGPHAGPLAESLRALRVSAGLSQEELARKAQLSVDAISALERGTRTRPHLATVRALSEALALNAESRAELIAVSRGVGPPVRRTSAAPTAQPLSSELVGRGEEVATVRELLVRRRLVTLTGPGGVGKSRLADAVGRSSVTHDSEEVVNVHLSGVGEPGLVGSRIAAALGVPWVEGGPPPQLHERLGDRPLLLVLDNFEHVLGAATLLPPLVAATPLLRILVTSRTPLSLRDEITYTVQPLGLPSPDASAVKDLEAAEGSRLLLLRLRALQRDFPVARHVPELAAVCREMGGLPLALELAASALRARSPDDLLRHVDRLLLRQGSVDLPERHRTLEAAIDWSYRLLDPSDQAIFRRLAVFVGGFGPDEVVAVGGTEVALEAVERLAASSLVNVRWQEDGRIRYDLLPPIAAFARSRLDAEEWHDAKKAHATWFAGAAERMHEDLYAGAQLNALSGYDEEQDNLWAATENATTSGVPQTAARLGWALWVFWWIRGSREHGRVQLTKVLERSLSDRDRARLLNAWAILADRSVVSARTIHDAFTQAGALARASGDRPAEATAVTGMGLLLLTQDDLEPAVDHLGRGLRLAEDAGAYGQWLTRQGEVFLATALCRLSAYDEAHERAHRAVEAAERSSDTLVLTIALHTLSLAQHGLGQQEAAEDSLRRAVALGESTGDVDNLQHLLVTMATMQLERTDAERIVALLGAAEAMRRRAGTAVMTPHANPAAVARLQEQTETRLSPRLWRDSFATGLDLDVPGACRLALAPLDPH